MLIACRAAGSAIVMLGSIVGKRILVPLEVSPLQTVTNEVILLADGLTIATALHQVNALAA